MFTKSAEFYDAIYQWKDYEGESKKIHEIVQQKKQSLGTTLLDAACGTGAHIPYLRQHYDITGLDLDGGMLAVARERFPEVPFHEVSMVDFDLGKQFDVITCLFSAIAYVKTVEALNQTLQTFAAHTKPGGVVIVEPWLRPEQIKPNTIHATFVDEPELKITRMNRTTMEGRLTIFDFEYLVGTPEGIEHFVERHEIGTFTHEEYMAAFEQADFDVQHDEEGLMGRGLYIGTRPVG